MALNANEKSALQVFKTRLEQELGSRLTELKLFGSKARGDDRIGSDLDVLVTTTDDDWHIADIIYSIAADVLLQTGVCISPKPISGSRLKTMLDEGAAFARNIEKDAVTV